MLHCDLKQNDAKTEVLLIGTNQQLNRIDERLSVRIGDDVISLVNSARNMGVVFDKSMSMDAHINAITRKSFLHLSRIKQKRKYLVRKTTELLIH